MIVRKLNQVLEGWANYFSYGTRTKAYRAIDHQVYQRAVDVLSKRHKTPKSTSRLWTDERIFGEMGVTRMRTLQLAGG